MKIYPVRSISRKGPSHWVEISFLDELDLKGPGILRGHMQGSLGSRGMKIWSMPHGDMGNDMNYNGPKVAKFLVG